MAPPSLRHQAYESILNWIVDGTLRRGSVTSEVELSRKLDMSRTPVRAALQQLEQEGYVRIAAKHGVIVLDSSSQRVGDLLDIIVSMTLFSVNVSWHSKRGELLASRRDRTEEWRRLSETGEEPPALILFEYEMLEEWISFCNNVEMIRTFRGACSRLFWPRNTERWQAPHRADTEIHLGRLLDSLAEDPASFREALFVYLQTLKRTWR